MTLLDALAAALRDRLLAGYAAPVPGVGILQRQRVNARVEPQADGSSLLLPPSETVAFVPGPAADDGALAMGLLRSLGTPEADAAGTLRQAIDQLEAHLAASGTAQLPGIGTMQRVGNGTAFAADPSLLASVARPYQGMAPVSAKASEPVPTPPVPRPTDASFIDETTLDDDLDDVLEAPLDTSDPGGLRAILPLALTPEPSSSAPQDPAPNAGHDDVDEAVETTDAPLGGVTLAASALMSPPEDESDVLPVPDKDSPVRQEPSVDSPPPEPEVGDVVTAPEPLMDAAPVMEEASDLGWLDDFDADDEPADARSGATIGVSPLPAEADLDSAASSSSHPPRLPKPPPIIAGPVEPTPKRGIPIWLWMLVPLLTLAALFFWYRTSQITAPPESILTAELAPDDNLARIALDTLTADLALTDTDSTESALGNAVTDDSSSGVLPVYDSATVEGEFPVEELTAPGNAPARTPPPTPRSTPTPPTARTTPLDQDLVIDRPNLRSLFGADLEALTGTAPIVSGQGGFSWVVLSTRDRDPADFRARQYRDAGWRVRVFQSDALGDLVYRVAIGQFISRDQADRLRPFLPSQVPADTWRLDLSTL